MHQSLGGCALTRASVLHGCTGARIVSLRGVKMHLADGEKQAEISVRRSGLCEQKCGREREACTLACLAYVSVVCTCLQSARLMAVCAPVLVGKIRLLSVPADLPVGGCSCARSLQAAPVTSPVVPGQLSRTVKVAGPSGALHHPAARPLRGCAALTVSSLSLILLY